MFRTNKIMMLLLALVLAVVLTSCANVGGRYTMIASKDFSADKLSEYQVVELDKPASNGKAMVALFIPFRPAKGHSERVDSALKDIPGAVAMLDAKHTLRVFNIPFFIAQYDNIKSSKVLVDPSLIKTEVEVVLVKE